MNLETARKKIDELDIALIEILAKRQELIYGVAVIKKRKKLPVEDVSREESMVAERMRIAQKKKINPEFVKEIFQLILQESKRIQGMIIG